MDNAIQVYCNDSFTVRTTREADGTVWFVGKDVLNALEYSETSTPAQIFQSVPDFWKGIKRIDTLEVHKICYASLNKACISFWGGAISRRLFRTKCG